MFFLKNVNLRKDKIDFEVIDELKKWSIQKGYTLKITDEEYPIYVSGHRKLYKIDGTRHQTNLQFSR